MTYTHKERAMALARAMKFQPLFSADYFDAIVDAIQVPDVPAGTRRTAFDAAVAGIKFLTDEEKDWLYNYLKNCTNVYWSKSGVTEPFVPASTGW